MAPEFVSNEELIIAARKRLAQGPWDYLVGGSESETTFRRNRLAFDRVAFRPRVLRGAGAPFLDHALVRGEDVAGAERFFIDVLGFTPAERMLASMDDDAPLVATWLSISNKTHDFALLTGADGGLHHFTFQLRDWNAVQNAGDQFVIEGTPIDLGPTRHGITRGETIYFFDPAGNRNEEIGRAHV